MGRFTTSALFLCSMFILTVILLMPVIPVIPVNSQSEPTATPTATPLPPRSLFVEDTCVPPCWFGLIPGETSAQEALVMLQQFENLFYSPEPAQESTFDAESGQMLDGSYIFSWRPEVWWKTGMADMGIKVRIREGIVLRVEVGMNRPVNIEQVLDSLGQPEHVMAYGIGDSIMIMGLDYPEISMALALGAQRDDCLASDILETFNVRSMYFYPPGSFPTPRLFFMDDSERFVPLDVWETWLRGEIEGTCLEVMEQLPIVTATPPAR